MKSDLSSEFANKLRERDIKIMLKTWLWRNNAVSQKEIVKALYYQKNNNICNFKNLIIYFNEYSDKIILSIIIYDPRFLNKDFSMWPRLDCCLYNKDHNQLQKR